MTCDICDAPLTGCPPYATFCICGIAYQACSTCCKEHGQYVKGRARTGHEQRRHQTEVGR